MGLNARVLCFGNYVAEDCSVHQHCAYMPGKDPYAIDSLATQYAIPATFP